MKKNPKKNVYTAGTLDLAVSPENLDTVVLTTPKNFSVVDDGSFAFWIQRGGGNHGRQPTRLFADN